jgi:hypothetical protein
VSQHPIPKSKSFLLLFHFKHPKNTLAMFKLTKHEQLIVAFVVGALVLGVAVKRWRELHSPPQDANITARGR